MLRLLPLLAFALVPAVLAAPVPPEPPSAFGAHGTVTRADLEKLTFDSRAVPDDELRGKSKEREDDIVEVKRVRGDGPPKPRPANPYDVAVHLPRTRVREGDPVPAYFVLRNNRDRPFAMRSRFDLADPTPRVRGEHLDFTVRDRATGKPVAGSVCGATHCGGGALAVVPEDGFYCAGADLNRLTGGALPPGQYDVSWRYGGLRSAPVLLTVSRRDGAKHAPRAGRTTLLCFHLTENLDDERDRDPRADGPVVWPETELEDVEANDLAAALAVGQHGVYAPDLHAVPKADAFVEAWAEWLPYRDGDRVRVTLRAVPLHKEVRLEDVPQLFLLVEVPVDAGANRRELPAKKLRALPEVPLRTTPLTIEARLPDGWRHFSDAPGAARVAVLVAGGEVELNRYGEVSKRQERDRRIEDPDVPVWRGFVRSDFTEVRFPLPAAVR